MSKISQELNAVMAKRVVTDEQYLALLKRENGNLGNMVRQLQEEKQNLSDALNQSTLINDGLVQQVRSARGHLNSCEEQAAVIEKLKKILDMAEAYFEGEDVATIRDKTTLRFGINEALTIPTDSKQVLAEWLDKVLGEPVEYRVYQINGMCDGHCVEGNYITIEEADAAASCLGEYWAGTDLLVKKPEIK